MSPTLLNIYVEKLIAEALEKARGLVVRGKIIKTIKYADDQAMLVESEEELHCSMMHSIVGIGEDF